MAKKLSDKIDKRIYDDWDHAYFLHVEGFHEARLDSVQVKNRIAYIEELLKISGKVLKNTGKNNNY